MKKHLGLFVTADSSKCTGCKACEMACFTVHARKHNPVGKTVGTVTVPVTARLFLTRADESCMPVQCKHCEDAPCLNACTKGAVSRIDSQVIVNEETCIGCKDCMMACPFGAIAILPVSKRGDLVMQTGCDEPKKAAFKCDFCFGMEEGPACVKACPHQVLSVVEPEVQRLDKNIRAAKALALLKSY